MGHPCSHGVTDWSFPSASATRQRGCGFDPLSADYDLKQSLCKALLQWMNMCFISLFFLYVIKCKKIYQITIHICLSFKLLSLLVLYNPNTMICVLIMQWFHDLRFHYLGNYTDTAGQILLVKKANYYLKVFAVEILKHVHVLYLSLKINTITKIRPQKIHCSGKVKEKKTRLLIESKPVQNNTFNI